MPKLGRVPKELEVERRAEAELEALFRERYAAVVRLAFAMTFDASVAEDLAQEAFVRTWRRWNRLSHPEAAYGYVRATAMNLARSALRRRLVELRHRRASTDEMHPPDAAGRLDLLRALQELPPRQRACVVLRYLEDLSEEQTARMLGVTVGTVKSQTHKALRRLESIVGGER